MKNRFSILSTISLLPIATISCSNISVKQNIIKNLSNKQIKQEFKTINGLLSSLETQGIFENSTTNFYENIIEQEVNNDVFTIISLNKTLKKWRKKTQNSKKIKLQAQKAKRKSKIISLVSWVLGISTLVGIGVYLFKYNRDPLHKAKAFVADFALKKYLKNIQKLDVDFEDILRNLIFYIFKENDYEDRRLIGFFIDKAKEIIFQNKDLNSLFSKEIAENWVKELDNQNSHTIKTNNPISYSLKMLEGNNGGNILKEFIKLFKKIFDKNDKFSNFSGFNTISEYFKKPQKIEGITSSLTSLITGFNLVKTGIDFLSKQLIKKLASEQKYIFNLLLQLIKKLRSIVNKGDFKIKYKEELQALYDLLFNILNKIFGDKVVFEQSLWITSIKLKVSDIITPLVIKNYIENYISDRSKETIK